MFVLHDQPELSDEGIARVVDVFQAILCASTLYRTTLDYSTTPQFITSLLSNNCADSPATAPLSAVAHPLFDLECANESKLRRRLKAMCTALFEQAVSAACVRHISNGVIDVPVEENSLGAHLQHLQQNLKTYQALL